MARYAQTLIWISTALIDSQGGRLSSRQKELSSSFWLTIGQKALCQKLLYVSSLSPRAEAALTLYSIHLCCDMPCGILGSKPILCMASVLWIISQSISVHL
jgi:hypothetical protein